MKKTKTGGRQKGTPNKKNKYDEVKQLIIKYLAKRYSYKKCVDKIYEIKSIKLSSSRLCEYVNEKNIFDEVEKYINSLTNEEKILHRIPLKKILKNTSNPIKELERYNEKYRLQPYLNLKYNRIHTYNYTLQFNSYLSRAYNEVRLFEEQIKEQIENYTIDDDIELLYEVIEKITISYKSAYEYNPDSNTKDIDNNKYQDEVKNYKKTGSILDNLLSK